MEWLLFQPQPDFPADECREVLVSPSSHPELQLWGPCHFLRECTFPESVSDAIILGAFLEDVFWNLSLPYGVVMTRVRGQSHLVYSLSLNSQWSSAWVVFCHEPLSYQSGTDVRKESTYAFLWMNVHFCSLESRREASSRLASTDHQCTVPPRNYYLPFW